MIAIQGDFPATLATLAATLFALGACADEASAQITPWTDHSAWQSVMASTAVADFEGYTGAVTNQHAGVTFGPFNGGTPTAFTSNSYFAPHAISGTGFMLGQTIGPSYGGGGFTTAFATEIDGLGMWIGGLHAFAGTTIRFLDSGGTELGLFDVTTLLPQSTFGWQFLGFTIASGPPIASIEFSIVITDYIGFDDLEFGTLTRAACSQRNGTGINLLEFDCLGDPTLGSNWTLDTNANAGSVLTFAMAAFAPAPTPIPLLGGELLIDTTAVNIPGLGTHTLAIPLYSTLVGLPLYLQGFRLDVVGPNLNIVFLNAIDAVIGY